jgi:hypothetical protein
MRLTAPGRAAGLEAIIVGIEETKESKTRGEEVSRRQANSVANRAPTIPRSRLKSLL